MNIHLAQSDHKFKQKTVKEQVLPTGCKMPVKTFTVNGSCPLIDRQTPVKTLPYDGKWVCGGVRPQGGTWCQHTILSNSPKNCMKSMVYAVNIFFSKVPAAKMLHETSSRMSVADLRGALLAPPLRIKIFSISCSVALFIATAMCVYLCVGNHNTIK